MGIMMNELERLELDKQRLYLPARRAAAVMGVGERLIRRLLEDGKLTYIEDGTKRLIAMEQCRRYLASMRQGGQEQPQQ